jgi:hypothetical protein
LVIPNSRRKIGAAVAAVSLVLSLMPGAVAATSNTAPVAVDDPGVSCTGGGIVPAYLIPEDYALAGEFGSWWASFLNQCSLLANDTDADGDTLSYEIVTPPSHGDTMLVSADPDWSAYRITQPNYSTKRGDQPGGNWVSDSFTYRAFDGSSYSQPASVRIWIAPVNDPPTLTAGPHEVLVAEDSGSYSGAWATDVSSGPSNESDQTVHFELLSLSVASSGPAPLFAEGPEIDGSGVLSFTLNPDVEGLAHVSMRPRDDGGLENYGMSQMLVQPDDTAPDVSFDIQVGADATHAVDDNLGAPADVVGWRLDVLANDAAPCCGTQHVVAVSQGSAGDVAVVPGGSAIRYSPHSGATFDSFTYTVGDGLGSTDTASVHVIVSGTLNVGPVAVDDSLTVTEDTDATSVPVLLNDTDAESDQLTISGVTNGLKGTVAMTGGGTGLTYTPNANATGSDGFSYTISDPGTPHTIHDVLGGIPKADTATVAVTITPANDAPDAVDDAVLNVGEGAGATALTVLANDTDVDADPLTITATTDGAHGTVAITSGGAGLAYDPVALYHGPDSFTYTVSDGHGGVDTATVHVSVGRDATAPRIVAPAARLIGQTIGMRTMVARVVWSATDAGSGVASYKLQASVNGGAFSTIAMPTTATAINRTLTDGATYRYRVRATDREGNTSAWIYGPTFVARRLQEASRSLAYTGSWLTATSSSMSGGHGRYASSRTRKVAFTATAFSYAWVASKTPTSGSARVYVDGVLETTISLRSSSFRYRQVVYTRRFSTLAKHTIEIRLVGNGRVDIDAFAVLR